MLNVLAWIAAVLAVIVLTEAIWITVLCIKTYKRRKNAWTKREKFNALALPLAPAAFLPIMWVVCGVLLAECALLTYILVNFYFGREKEETPKKKRAPIERVVFNAPVEQFHEEPTEEDIHTLEALQHHAVTFDEASHAISDEVAERFIKFEKTNTAVTFENKCIINIDTISDAFVDDETVNLKTLKEKGLIKENADYVKILARGTLDKKLFVEANSFSVDAVKMILLTGGTVTKDV